MNATPSKNNPRISKAIMIFVPVSGRNFLEVDLLVFSGFPGFFGLSGFLGIFCVVGGVVGL